jgi:hypothetical protein
VNIAVTTNEQRKFTKQKSTHAQRIHWTAFAKTSDTSASLASNPTIPSDPLRLNAPFRRTTTRKAFARPYAQTRGTTEHKNHRVRKGS